MTVAYDGAFSPNVSVRMAWISFGVLPCRGEKKYNFYLVTEVPDHVYVFYAYRLYFADKDIYMIRYFYHKIEIIRLLFYY